MAHLAFSADCSSFWYLDSGCSRHMTGNKSLFTKLEKWKGGLVTFGDGNKGKIRGKGSVSIPDFPSLIEVLYVEGLNANLLSIGQFCDDLHEVKFSKE